MRKQELDSLEAKTPALNGSEQVAEGDDFHAEETGGAAADTDR